MQFRMREEVVIYSYGSYEYIHNIGSLVMRQEVTLCEIKTEENIKYIVV